MKTLGELDDLNLKLTEAKNGVQKELNQKSIMALEIRMFGEQIGTITDFNSALGAVLRSRVRIPLMTFFLKLDFETKQRSL